MNFFSNVTQCFDLPVLEWIAANLKCAALDILMPIITLLGDGGIFWIVTTVVLLILPKCRKVGMAMGFALLLSVLICNITLKPLIARIRPYDYQLIHFNKQIELLIPALGDFSFPSGHTLICFVSATVIFLNHKAWGAAALISAILVAFSRLYLYVHYPTDVLASIAIGIVIAFIANYLAKICYPPLVNFVASKKANAA